ncbi:MAG: chromosome segregation protein SMC [Hyphomicrobiaceae bacterium]|nr:chromosome segregation protein SMC [Hyphomicrobiaceae bacterium]
MHIQRLRLLGFKSFVEPVDLLVEKGLTGVVGPNGCGKSNLLEALRWVMGETSHKSMRAAAMDDVIFSGTAMRPARNSAEVTIFVDNSQRKAPAEFNGADTIEITRRIEREAGSAYRINGREVRARDVKILFEDAATGARSPSLVRQGQIGEIVNAKPDQRRRILEDAAGVAGLHSRRHEAELRLKAAENNLARLADILGQIGSQIESLKRQTRQVKRYKELSAEIRRAEAMLLHLQWAEAQAQVEAEESALTDAMARLGAAVETEAGAVRQEAAIAQSLQPLREEEATRAAILARIKVQQESFEREADRAREREAELEGRAAQLAADLEREDGLIREARQITAHLNEEQEALSRADARAAEQGNALRADLAGAHRLLQAAEARLEEITARTFEARARKQSLDSMRAERKDQAARLERQLAGLEVQARDIAAKAPDVLKLTETQELGRRLSLELAELETHAIGAEERVAAAAGEAKRTRESSRLAELAARQLTTELATLAKLLMPAQDVAYPPVVDLLQVAPGYELALGAALGDDLDAPAASEAAAHWRLVEPSDDDAPLPAGAEPLIERVDGPPELTRRLRQIGVVPREVALHLQPALKPGQRLVSREGDLWRWDGFVAAADAPTAAAQRLAERNRLAGIRSKEQAARNTATAAAAEAAGAAERHRRAEEDERRLRQAWRETQGRLARTREQLNVIERAARETEGRLAAVAEAKARAQSSLAEARARLTEIEAGLAEIGADNDCEPLLADAQQQARSSREHVSERRAALAGLERERQVRAERMAAAAAELERWSLRAASAEQQIGTLQARLQEAKDELSELARLPPLIEDKRHKLLSALSRAEEEREAAADRLAQAEAAQRQAAQALRSAQAAVSTEREARARSEARLEAVRQRRSAEVARIRDTLGVAPEGCLGIAEAKPGAPLPALAEVDRHLSRLRADRERLGGVNLQAEEELQALQEQHSRLDAERGDVASAIASLRGGIGQLNREARKRLQDAFNVVDGHFRRLFTTLFGGGEARLEMVESEDPLEGGLEIIAKPPGKKPATLSLLSGGEQTLTALSLIFAVFLTNPSPICVLDEVDAPLDDANVDRFCTLMERMAEETETRFLVITHHPMTMARMNRLFGVTMGEKGVSQLVSVDLAAAERFLEAV